MQTLEYWLLWSALFVGIGAGFALLNNLGEIPLACLLWLE